MLIGVQVRKVSISEFQVTSSEMEVPVLRLFSFQCVQCDILLQYSLERITVLSHLFVRLMCDKFMYRRFGNCKRGCLRAVITQTYIVTLFHSKSFYM